MQFVYETPTRHDIVLLGQISLLQPMSLVHGYRPLKRQDLIRLSNTYQIESYNDSTFGFDEVCVFEINGELIFNPKAVERHEVSPELHQKQLTGIKNTVVEDYATFNRINYPLYWLVNDYEPEIPGWVLQSITNSLKTYKEFPNLYDFIAETPERISKLKQLYFAAAAKLSNKQTVKVKDVKYRGKDSIQSNFKKIERTKSLSYIAADDSIIDRMLELGHKTFLGLLKLMPEIPVEPWNLDPRLHEATFTLEDFETLLNHANNSTPGTSQNHKNITLKLWAKLQLTLLEKFDFTVTEVSDGLHSLRPPYHYEHTLTILIDYFSNDTSTMTKKDALKTINYVLNTDYKNRFPSCAEANNIYGILLQKGLTPAEIVSIACYEDNKTMVSHVNWLKYIENIDHYRNVPIEWWFPLTN